MIRASDSSPKTYLSDNAFKGFGLVLPCEAVMMQPRPLSPRKTVQLMVVLTILAWATQTLFRQWGYGGVVFPAAPEAQSLGEAQTPNSADAATTQASTPDYSRLTD